MELVEQQEILAPSNYGFDEGYVQGDYFYVCEHATPFERVVLDAMRGAQSTIGLSAKIRCSTLAVGEFPCAVPGWHWDLVTDKNDPAPEESHQIWVSGTPPLFEGPQVLTPETVYGYGRVKHRATRAIHSGPRLFIRVSRSHKMRLHNRNQGR